MRALLVVLFGVMSSGLVAQETSPKFMVSVEGSHWANKELKPFPFGESFAANSAYVMSTFAVNVHRRTYVGVGASAFESRLTKTQTGFWEASRGVYGVGYAEQHVKFTPKFFALIRLGALWGSAEYSSLPQNDNEARVIHGRGGFFSLGFQYQPVRRWSLSVMPFNLLWVNHQKMSEATGNDGLSLSALFPATFRVGYHFGPDSKSSKKSAPAPTME